MRSEAAAIVLALRAHGEHGAVVRLLTEVNGLVSGYVRGARGRRMRPVLIPGNRVQAGLAARSAATLAQATLELDHSIAPLLGEPLAAAAIEWVTALTATALPEGQPYPRLYVTLGALLDAIEAAPAASGWGAALVRYELLMLAELGFGLDLSQCAATGAVDDLVAVSPRSGRAVSAEAAEPYGDRLLPLPAFLLAGGSAQWSSILDGLTLSGHFLMRDVVPDRSEALVAVRQRLVERLRRAAGLA